MGNQKENFMKFLVAYLITAIVFLVIDYIWLGFVMKDYFQEQLGHLMADEVNFGIAAIFYLFFAAGIVVLAVFPALESGSWVKAAYLGAIIGAMAYGTYDITNMATLRDWPTQMSVIDIAWGTSLTALCSVAGFFGTNYYLNS